MRAVPSPFAIPSRLPAISLATLVTVSGCAKTQTATVDEPVEMETDGEVITDTATTPEELQKSQPAVREQALPSKATLTPVKIGNAPLVYMVDSPQTVQVMDETAGVVIAESVLSRRMVLRVDERNGVIAGNDQLFAGPLPKGRRYGIYVVPDGQNLSRTGRYMPRPTREPMPTPPQGK